MKSNMIKTQINDAVIKYQKWRFQRAFAPKVKAGKPIKLHLGAGDVILEDYINIDIRKLTGIDFAIDITRLSFIGNDMVDEIYTCHTLEHISHTTNMAILTEWRRVLKIGGKLLISVPDFDKIVEVYQASNGSIWDIKSPLMGEQDYPEDAHYSVYNFAYLKQILLHVGFASVRAMTKRDSVTDKDWSFRKLKTAAGKQFVISLNVIATK